MVERKGGVGGFGAIASDNTDQRSSAYSPHTIVRHTDWIEDRVLIKCVKCGKAWFHPRGDPWVGVPKECQRDEG